MYDEDEIYRYIGKELATARKYKRNITQDDMAKLLNLTRTSISNIERGRQKASLGLIYLYCSIVGKKITEVLPSLDDVLEREITTGTNITVGDGQRLVPDKVADMIKLID